MMKKLCTVLAVVLLLLSGCGANEGAFSAADRNQESAVPMDAANKTPDETEENGSETVLTLAVYGGTRLPIVEAFNESQSVYHIEVEDYSKEGTIHQDSALARINMELASGEGPDILYLWNLGMNSAVYGPKGYLEDLLPYLDADEALNREDFVDSLMDAALMDGKLYGTIPSFSVFTMFGPSARIDQYQPATFTELLQLAQDNGGAAQLIQQDYSDMDFLYTVLRVSSDEFVDFGTMTADFDNDNFRALLELCLQFGQNTGADKSAAILNYCAVSSFMETQYYEAYYGEKMEFFGCPGAAEPKNYFINIIDQYGMNANSKHKEGAWSFLRLLFTEEYQVDAYVDSAFPAFPGNRNALQALAEKSMSTLYDSDEEGNQWEFTQRGEHDDFAYHAATQDQVDQIMDLIHSASQASNYTAMIQTIVMEEAQAYFVGDADIDDTVHKIQNRVDTYLAEQQ